MDVQEGGKRLRALRIKQELTLDQLSKRSGVPKQRISDIELGKINNPGFKEVVRIAWGLGITPDQAAAFYGLK